MGLTVQKGCSGFCRNTEVTNVPEAGILAEGRGVRRHVSAELATPDWRLLHLGTGQAQSKLEGKDCTGILCSEKSSSPSEDAGV